VTAAEYRTLREACGLSLQAAADFHDVSIRTVQHWETGRNNVPDGAGEELGRLNAGIERAVSEAVGLYREKGGEHGAPDVVALVRYRSDEDYAGSRAAREGLPHACHNALIGRLKLALERVGARVEISYGE
jgi:transcriptional regulator with XRE-family HTH domain